MKIEVTIRIHDEYNVVAESSLTRMTVDNARIMSEYADAVNDAQVSLDGQLRPIIRAQQARTRTDAETSDVSY